MLVVVAGAVAGVASLVAAAVAVVAVAAVVATTAVAVTAAVVDADTDAVTAATAGAALALDDEISVYTPTNRVLGQQPPPARYHVTTKKTFCLGLGRRQVAVIHRTHSSIMSSFSTSLIAPNFLRRDRWRTFQKKIGLRADQGRNINEN